MCWKPAQQHLAAMAVGSTALAAMSSCSTHHLLVSAALALLAAHLVAWLTNSIASQIANLLCHGQMRSPCKVVSAKCSCAGRNPKCMVSDKLEIGWCYYWLQQAMSELHHDDNWEMLLRATKNGAHACQQAMLVPSVLESHVDYMSHDDAW